MSYRQGYRPQTQQPARSPSGGQARQQVKSSKPRKKKRNRPIRIFLLLVLLAFVATAGVMGYSIYDEINSVEKQGTFYPGVYIDNVPLNGATPYQAYDYLYEKASAAMQGWQVVISYGDDMRWTITPDDLGLAASLKSVIENEINKAYTIGRTGSMIDRVKTVLALKTEPYHGYTSGVEKNMGIIDAMVAEIKATIDTPAIDATTRTDFSRKSNPFVIENEQYGREVDAAALKAQIVDMVNNMQSGTISVQPNVVEPTVKASMLTSDVVLIASASTDISKRSTEGRTFNVALGCEKINGYVLENGAKFSFNKIVGNRTKENGFQEAEEIAGGKYRLDYGGGICQTSSTLYNAVVQANLKVTTRRNHGIPVNYLPKGADATVYNDRIDFVFENNTGAPVYITARVDKVDGVQKCIVQIYGRPEPNGYTYGMRHEEVEVIPIPEPEYIKDRSAEYVVYTDEEHVSFKGAEGYVVRTYRVVKDANGNVISDGEFMYEDTYAAQTPTVYVGVSKRPE